PERDGGQVQSPLLGSGSGVEAGEGVEGVRDDGCCWGGQPPGHREVVDGDVWVVTQQDRDGALLRVPGQPGPPAGFDGGDVLELPGVADEQRSLELARDA